MAKVKTINQYRTIQMGDTTIEIPTAQLPDGSIDEDTQLIMEMNFNQYINVLADILVDYASNFNSGQIWVTPVSAIHSHLISCLLCLVNI